MTTFQVGPYENDGPHYGKKLFISCYQFACSIVEGPWPITDWEVGLVAVVLGVLHISPECPERPYRRFIGHLGGVVLGQVDTLQSVLVCPTPPFRGGPEDQTFSVGPFGVYGSLVPLS